MYKASTKMELFFEELQLIQDFMAQSCVWYEWQVIPSQDIIWKTGRSCNECITVGVGSPEDIHINSALTRREINFDAHEASLETDVGTDKGFRS